MRKGPAGAGPKASRTKKCTTHYKRSLPVLQISPAALASLACLQRLRFGYDCWNALGRPDWMPQPRDFGLNLADHHPAQVLWGST